MVRNDSSSYGHVCCAQIPSGGWGVSVLWLSEVEFQRFPAENHPFIEKARTSFENHQSGPTTDIAFVSGDN